MAQSIVLNRALGSGLGRPDTVARNVESRPSVGTPPIAAQFSARANPARLLDTGGGSASRGPAVALMVLIAGYGAWLYWIHPHLA